MDPGERSPGEFEPHFTRLCPSELRPPAAHVELCLTKRRNVHRSNQQSGFPISLPRCREGTWCFLPNKKVRCGVVSPAMSGEVNEGI